MPAALIPVFPVGAQPPAGTTRPESITRTVAGVDEATARLSPATQEESAELSNLQRFAPARMFVAGAWSPWPEASVEGVGRILEISCNSRLHLHGLGHAALLDPVLGVWCARPGTWTAIGYRGRPEVE